MARKFLLFFGPVGIAFAALYSYDLASRREQDLLGAVMIGVAIGLFYAWRGALYHHSDHHYRRGLTEGAQTERDFRKRTRE